MKVQVFLDVMLRCLVTAADECHASETLSTIYQSIWHNRPVNLNLHQHWCENLKSHTNLFCCCT